MAFDPNNYFDIWNIIVYEIVGGIELTMALGIILIAFFSAKYMIPFQVSLISMFLFLAIVVGITGDMSLWTILILIVGVLFYIIISRLMRRG